MRERNGQSERHIGTVNDSITPLRLSLPKNLVAARFSLKFSYMTFTLFNESSICIHTHTHTPPPPFLSSVSSRGYSCCCHSTKKSVVLFFRAFNRNQLKRKRRGMRQKSVRVIRVRVLPPLRLGIYALPVSRHRGVYSRCSFFATGVFFGFNDSLEYY